MYANQNGEIRSEQFKREFSLLRESDYWQYLPESTRNKIVDMLDEEKQIDSQHKGDGFGLENP